MTDRLFTRHCFWPVVCVLALVFGCQGNDSLPQADQADRAEPTADPHEVPLTEQEIEQLRQQTAQYDAALEHLKSLRDTLQQQLAAGHLNAAHRTLDKLDYVLRRLPQIARDSEIPRSRWEQINTTARRLRGLFDQVHHAMDEGQTPDYGAVAEDIERALKNLE